MAGRSRMVGAVVAVAGKRYWRQAEARVVVDAWRKSGQPLPEFAAALRVRAQRIARWAEQLEEPAPRAGTPADVDFHPVRVVGADRDRGRREPIEVLLGEGLRVRVPEGFASDDLARVLAVLEARAAC
ncbi:MAG: hypothetical protein HYZ29_24900 [Myxococcales bacterium]|nr:hypothetical protein [Myxococcales bacterium]